jgi:glycogen debranching enzyme
VAVAPRRIDPVEAERVAAEARRVLMGNRQSGISGWDGMRYDFVCPSPTHYPFQWFWDSAFHAIALLHVDPELAKQELRCLMQGAQDDGFIAHMLLWERDAHAHWLEDEYSIRRVHPYFTATIQPPVVARAVERIFEHTGDLAFVRELLPPIVRFFDWLARVRDPDRDGLVAIIQPDESGLDASPKYDRAMAIPYDPPGDTLPALQRSMQRLFDAYKDASPEQQPLLDVFLFEDVMVNAIYADGLRALARLSRAVGAPDPDRFERASRRTLDALMRKCWDPEVGVFWDLSGAAEEQARVLTFTSLFPLILPDLDPAVAKRLVHEHLLNENEFWLPYPVPSVAANEASFDPTWRTKTTWRGPTWVNVNWYLYWGLRTHGFDDVASELARRTVAMQARGGIREFYDPFTAEGYGATDFGWSCLSLDLIAAERSAAATT